MVLYALLAYLQMPAAQVAVLLPGAMAIACVRTTPARERQQAFQLLVLSTVFSLLTARWSVTADTRELFILPWSFLGVALLLWSGVAISASTAYWLTFFSLWTTDMAKAMELVPAGEASWQMFYYGVGGAGLQDGLVIFPLLSALLVHYAQWRRAGRGGPPGASPYRIT
jgi:hypothetical protein